MRDKYFDHKLGSQNDKTSKKDVQLTKRILDAYIKEQSIQEIRENQRIGIILEMKSYLQNDTKSTIQAGEFLNKLFKIYNIKKSKFAELIGYENANLHALLKGRRKFNSKLASIIGEVFKIKAETWLYIEAKNELKSFSLKNKIKLKKINLDEISHRS
jgi:plasmid maintenance system antidote protein VapI